MCAVKRSDIGRLHRLLPARERRPREDVAKSAGVGRWKIGLLERNELSALTLDELDRCFYALNAKIDVQVRYEGAQADRLLDERHARLVAAFVRLLTALGWEARVEVSFSEY